MRITTIGLDEELNAENPKQSFLKKYLGKYLSCWQKGEVYDMANLDYEIGSDNVYQDLGYDDSVEMKIKANGVRVPAKLINASDVTQQKVADILGIDQPKISRMLRGHFRGLSMEKIMSYILKLGKDIDITVCEKKEADSVGHLNFWAV